MFTRIISSLVASPLRSFLVPLVGVGLAGAIWITGCGRSDANHGEIVSIDGSVGTESSQEIGVMSQALPPRVPVVAVIDVNGVAEQTGMLDQLNELVRQKEQQAQQQFAALQNQLLRQYQQSEQQYKLQQNPDAQSLLDELQQQHMQTLTAHWRDLQTEISNYHSQQKSEFLGMVRPMAFAVAKSKGMSMVLTTSQVFSVDAQANITDEVAKKMLQIAASSQQSPVPEDRMSESRPGISTR